MYAESNVTSGMVHVIHTELTLRKYVRILLYSRVSSLEFFLLHALIVKSKRLAVAAMASMSGKIVYLTLALGLLESNLLCVSRSSLIY